MVWMINCFVTKHRKTGIVERDYDIDVDKIFQTVNVMFDLHRKRGVNELNCLLSSGVNIINVDLTLHDKKFLRDVVSVLESLESGDNDVYPPPYYRPITLSVTMNSNDSALTSDHRRTDFIILKDLTTADEIREFRKRNFGIKSISIMPWIRELEIDATNELIKISDGIVLDVDRIKFNQNYYTCLRKYFAAMKPVFYVRSHLVREYGDEFCNDRKIMITADFLIDTRFDGVFLCDGDDKKSEPEQLIQSLIKAMKLAGDNIDPENDYFKHTSLDVKTPLLAPHGLALSACLAAIKSAASLMIILTVSGHSARILAFAAPPCPVIAVTAKKSSVRKMQLYKKVLPLYYTGERVNSWRAECQNRIDFGTKFALTSGIVNSGAKLVVLAPMAEGVGYCDSFYITSIPFLCEDDTE